MDRQAAAPDIATQPASAGQMSANWIRRRALEAAAAYAAVMLAVSWVVGSVREFMVMAGADAAAATLAQMAVTLLFLAHAAGWVVRVFGLPPSAGLRLSVGSAASALFAAFVALSAVLFGVSPLDLSPTSLTQKALGIGLMIAVAAILPALRGRADEV